MLLQRSENFWMNSLFKKCSFDLHKTICEFDLIHCDRENLFPCQQTVESISTCPFIIFSPVVRALARDMADPKFESSLDIPPSQVCILATKQSAVLEWVSLSLPC